VVWALDAPLTRAVSNHAPRAQRRAPVPAGVGHHVHARLVVPPHDVRFGVESHLAHIVRIQGCGATDGYPALHIRVLLVGNIWRCGQSLR